MFEEGQLQVKRLVAVYEKVPGGGPLAGRVVGGI